MSTERAQNRPLLIVNPAAGSGRTGKDLARLLPAVERALGDVAIAPTVRRGHAVELARRGAEDGHDLIVAVGGDGTLNEVVNGVLQFAAAERDRTQRDVAGAGGPRPTPRIGLIAAGTGGDFRHSLGIDDRPQAYVDALAGGGERTVDAARARFRMPDGTIAERYWVNVLSVGAGGLVVRYIERLPAALGGRAIYYLASLSAIARCVRAPLNCTIVSGGQSSERRLAACEIAVCNGSVFGAGMQVAPMARVDDGRLEAIIVDAQSKRELVALLRKVYTGAHIGAPGVEHLSCESLTIDLDEAATASRAGGGAAGRRAVAKARDRFTIEIDGEPSGGLPLTIDVLPNALTLRC
jgi:diacylglycerol kinase (ATP)